MSVLVKGMKMPEIKENKSIKAEIRNLDGRLELGIMTGGYYCCEQWSYYPIIEVPDGHGRLIDASRFKNNMDNACDAGGWLEPITSAVKEYVKKNIDAEKTVIPAEEEQNG